MPSQKILAIYLLLFLPLPLLAKVNAEIKFNYKRGSYKGCYYDVIVTKNGVERNITIFRPWEEVRDIKLSPDDHYLLVWHKPQHGSSCLLSVYDIQTYRLVKQMAPGHGGELTWNDRHQIIHEWGCGSNCANLVIYDVRLNELFFTLSSSGFLLSPDKNFLLQASQLGNEICVYDLRRLKRGAKPLSYVSYTGPDTVYNANFLPQNKLELIPEDSQLHLPNKYIDLDKVHWQRVSAEDLGFYYRRRF